MNYSSRDKLFRYGSVLLTSSLLFSGCNKVWVNGPSTPDSKMSSTGVGAAAGAVIGAGVGTIIGSTSGHAGEGLVIGSIAGAAAGGAIGRGLDGQGDQLQDTREALTRQDEVIRSQRQEIDGLRREFDDQFSRNNRPSSYQGRSYSMDNYGGNPGARSYDSSDVLTADSAGASTYAMNDSGRSYARSATTPKVASFAAQAPAARTRPAIVPPASAKARLSEPEIVKKPAMFKPVVEARRESVSAIAPALKPAAAKANVPTFAAPVAEPVKTASAAVETTRPKLFAAAETAAAVEKPALVAGNTPANTTANTPAIRPVGFGATPPQTSPIGGAVVPQFADPASQPVTEVAKAAPVSDGAVKDPGCAKAEDEAGRASRASSAADKLFYFRRALRFCPSNSSYHVEIGQVYQSIGREDDAEFEYQQAVNLDGGNADAKRLLSELK